jgi:hypothetical protein
MIKEVGQFIVNCRRHFSLPDDWRDCFLYRRMPGLLSRFPTMKRTNWVKVRAVTGLCFSSGQQTQPFPVNLFAGLPGLTSLGV